MGELARCTVRKGFPEGTSKIYPRGKAFPGVLCGKSSHGGTGWVYGNVRGQPRTQAIIVRPSTESVDGLGPRLAPNKPGSCRNWPITSTRRRRG